MIKKLCHQCGEVAFHNDKKEGHRCTYCGFPVSTNPAKHEYQRELMNRQASKAQIKRMK
jgi:ribosomal protein L37E